MSKSLLNSFVSIANNFIGRGSDRSFAARTASANVSRARSSSNEYNQSERHPMSVLLQEIRIGFANRRLTVPFDTPAWRPSATPCYAFGDPSRQTRPRTQEANVSNAATSAELAFLSCVEASDDPRAPIGGHSQAPPGNCLSSNNDAALDTIAIGMTASAATT